MIDQNALKQFILQTVHEAGITANQQPVQQQPVQQQPVQQQPAHDPFGGLGGGQVQQPVQQQVTPEMIQSLIMPLVEKPEVKQRLAAEMQAMGIQNLPDAKPEQLPELYQRFQRVAQEAQGQQMQQPQQQAVAGGAPSII